MDRWGVVFVVAMTGALTGCGASQLADGASAYVANERADVEAKLRGAVDPSAALAAADPNALAARAGVDPSAFLGRGGAAAEKHASRAVGAEPGRGESVAYRTGMAIPATDDPGSVCSSESDSRCRRTRLVTGPFVVTSIYTSGGCPDELALFAGNNVTRPRWSVLVLPNDRTNVAGDFVVEEGEVLYASARASTDLHQGTRCGVVWSGYRP